MNHAMMGDSSSRLEKINLRLISRTMFVFSSRWYHAMHMESSQPFLFCNICAVKGPIGDVFPLDSQACVGGCQVFHRYAECRKPPEASGGLSWSVWESCGSFEYKHACPEHLKTTIYISTTT